MSCRAAADRFGVAASTVVKWMRRWRETGSCAPRPQGGDKRSGRIETHAGEILALIAARVDITLAEIAELLARLGASGGQGPPRPTEASIQLR